MSTVITKPASTPKDVDWSAFRKDFPILDQRVNGHPLVYFDNAATSQKPKAVLDAINHYYLKDNSNVHRGIHELSNRSTAAFEKTRTRVAQFINAKSSDEIVFTSGTTGGVNLVSQAWGTQFVKAGDQILLTEMEHHSNIVPWQLLAERVGAQIRYIPVTGDEGLLDLSKLDQYLTNKVKIFAFTHISNTLGTINPAKELCARAKKMGIKTLVDAAQSAGHMPLDVQDLDCDFLAFSSHKICGPTGVGVLYGKLEELKQTPPYQGGGEMISTVDFDKSTWNVVPHKFEAGTPNIAGVVALSTALDYLDSIGRENILRHDQDLAQYTYDQLLKLPNIRLFGPKTGRAGLVSFLLNDVHAHDVVTVADQKGVALRGGHHCNQPLMKKLGIASTARASFYFYNTKAEVDRLIEVIRDIQKFFAS